LLLLIYNFFFLFHVGYINTNGVVRGYPVLATCDGIFYGSMEEFIGGFFVFFHIQTVLVAEFYGVIHVTEQAQKMDLTSLWPVCDSALVCALFTVRTNVPWMFCNR